MKYVLSGDGATSIFTIDENTGDIHATKRLDREVQAYYTLQAQAVDRLTNLPVEPRSEFVVKVQDINDNEPKFADGPYLAGVPEMSPLGKLFFFSSTCPPVRPSVRCLRRSERVLVQAWVPYEAKGLRRLLPLKALLSAPSPRRCFSFRERRENDDAE